MRGEFAFHQIHMRNHAEKFALFLLHFLKHDNRFLEHLGIERSKAFVEEHGINAYVAARQRRDAKSQRETHEEPFATRNVVDRTNRIAVVMVNQVNIQRTLFSHHFITREHIVQIAVRDFQQIA